MKKKFFTVRAIWGCFCILFSVYIIFTNVPYGQSAGFNYSALLFALILLVSGIVQIIRRDKPIEKRRIWLVLVAIFVAALAILIATVVNQKKQIEKLEKMGQSQREIK